MNKDKKQIKGSIIVVILAAAFVVLGFLAWRFFPYKDKKIPVKVLILPKLMPGIWRTEMP